MNKQREQSVLQWSPGCGAPPRVACHVERLKRNDLGLPGPGLGAFWPYGSLIDAFAGKDPALRRAFQEDFFDLIAENHPATLHPGGRHADQPNLNVCTYQVPWEWDQERFLRWIEKNRGLDDFLEPAGRRNIPHRNAIASPMVDDPSEIDAAFLALTHGRAVRASPEELRLHSDNRYNPYRWVGPMNEVQHHEQPSICATIPAAPGVYEDVREHFSEALTGEPSQRLLLRYDLDVEIKDHSRELGEKSIWDFHGTRTLHSPSGVVGQSQWNALMYSAGEESHGHRLSPAQQAFLRRWLDLRYVAANIQLSLMVNFRERDERYRLLELMLLGYQQEPIFFFDESLPLPENGTFSNPFTLEGNGIIPTAHAGMNRHIVDGGCSGPFAWTRAPISAYCDPEVTENTDEGRFPIIREGGRYIELSSPELARTRLGGIVDITQFHAASRRAGYFPGQRGYWGHGWTGFEGDDPLHRDAGEEHGLEWLGIIFENHGPFSIDCLVRQMDLCWE